MDTPVKQPVQATDYDTCALEPIHIPGTIQPFGVMIAGHLDLSEITHCSENIASILGISPEQALASSFTDILPEKAVPDLRRLLVGATARTQRERLGTYAFNDTDFEIFGHVGAGDIVILEFEAVDGAAVGKNLASVEEIRKLLAVASTAASIEGLMATCATGLQETLGYDRVMGYRYEDNGDGEVIVEARNPDVESFLGLRYPAWDVPEQARAIQIKTPLRMLVDIGQTPVAVLAKNATTPPLDMSLSHLRGISPIHVEYLGNMGVGGSLTIGLIVEGRLWGMFACHHMAPRVISSEMRISAELFGQFVSFIIKQKIDVAAYKKRQHAAEVREKIFAKSDEIDDFIASFETFAPVLMEVIESDGLALTSGQTTLTVGDTPAPSVIEALTKYHPNQGSLVCSFDSLAQAGFEGASETQKSAGALLVRASGIQQTQLTFFRNEDIRQLNWAGRPQKELEQGPDGPRISPRRSFEAYIEKQRGYGKLWEKSIVWAANELQILLTQIAAKGERALLLRHKELTSHKRQQDLMIAELNHRVKNTLSLIRSLSRQAKATSGSLEAYANALERRISALATAHDLAVTNTMMGVSLRAILETELAPYLNATFAQVIMSGPGIGLRADVAPMIALVLHEVVTNAAKYGALSTTDGVVRVQWTVDDDNLTVNWREMGGPEVIKTGVKGFGSSLIEQAIPYELDGSVQLDLKSTGAELTFSIPGSGLVHLEEKTQKRVVGEIAQVESVAVGKTAFLIEDNAILAMDMVESLTQLGAADIQTASSYEVGLELASTKDADFALLDMNLRGTVSFGIAEKLLERKIPFCFVTGYGTSMEIPENLSGAIVLAKPMNESLLSKTIEKLLNDEG